MLLADLLAEVEAPHRASLSSLAWMRALVLLVGLAACRETIARQGRAGTSAAAAAPVPAAQPAQAHGYQWQQQQQQAQAATAAPTVTHGYTPSPSQSHWQPPQPQHTPTVPQWQQPAAAPQQQWQQPAPAPQQHWQQQAAAEAPGPSSYGGVKPGLPQNWERKIDPGSGKPYYTDHNTQQTYWNPPAG